MQIVALTRSGAVLANQEILLAYMFRKNGWIKRAKLQVKNKEETQKKKLLEMQEPTSVQIEKQVSVEVDNQLNQKVCASALKKLSSKNKKRKRKGLAKEIAKATNKTNLISETVHATILEGAATNTGELEQGEMIPSVPLPSVANVVAPSNQQSSASNIQYETEANVARGRGRSRGRGRRSFYRNTGENDPYDMSIAPLNLFENQVIPIGLHNLSKSFRPKISTVRVLSLGTKFIPKWKFEKRNNAFKNFNDFIRRMHNKIYFTNTKTRNSGKNSKFKLKTKFVANTNYKEVEAFGWKVRDRINDAIEAMEKTKIAQNMSSKEKTALGNLIRTKNKSIDKRYGQKHGCRRRR